VFSGSSKDAIPKPKIKTTNQIPSSITGNGQNMVTPGGQDITQDKLQMREMARALFLTLHNITRVDENIAAQSAMDSKVKICRKSPSRARFAHVSPMITEGFNGLV
jgi:hypothetical protein